MQGRRRFLDRSVLGDTRWSENRRLTPQGRKVRERGMMSRSGLLNSTNFSPAEYEQLREKMVKLRSYLSDEVSAKP